MPCLFSIHRTTHRRAGGCCSMLLAQAAGEMESGRMGGIPNAKEAGSYEQNSGKVSFPNFPNPTRIFILQLMMSNYPKDS